MAVILLPVLRYFSGFICLKELRETTQNNSQIRLYCQQPRNEYVISKILLRSANHSFTACSQVPGKQASYLRLVSFIFLFRYEVTMKLRFKFDWNLNSLICTDYRLSL